MPMLIRKDMKKPARYWMKVLRMLSICNRWKRACPFKSTNILERLNQEDRRREKEEYVFSLILNQKIVW